MVAEGNYKSSLVLLAEELGISRLIEFKGWVPTDQSSSWSSNVDFLSPVINSSVTRIVTPLKVVELLRNNRNCICSDFPVYREIKNIENIVILVEPDDAIELSA